MAGKLNEKIAIVTGATSGIGTAIAKEYAKEGAKVVVSGRSVERGNKVVEDIKNAGGEATFIRCDMLIDDEIKNLISKTVEIYGGIDILVNNAGIWAVNTLETSEIDEFERILDTNLKAQFFCTKYAMPHIEARKGNVIHIASYNAYGNPGGTYAYSASKAAFAHVSKLMAKEYGPRGVRVNTICPGIIETPIFGGIDITPYGAAMPLGRVGQPEDIAKPAVFLASDDAAYITGVSLMVDGGMLLNG